MCRMMGAVSNDKIKAEWLEAFEPLASTGKTRIDMPEPGHHDGWGIVAYFRENFPEYVDREPHSVTQDPEHFKEGAKLIENSKSKIALVHFRKISVGQPAISNTHPFLYKEWSFCHNGTIYDSEKIPLKKLKPGGVTDSERFFLYIMENLDSKNVPGSIKKSAEEIRKGFKYSSLTFLLTDGKKLYAYRDYDALYQDYYTLHFSKLDESRIVSSEPLSAVSPSWQTLQNGEFLSL